MAKQVLDDDSLENLPEYHLVQSCIPGNISIEQCKENGYMFVVVGQEVYDDSPFTREIEYIMDGDVKSYYGFIVLIFIVVKICLFSVLWSWLRIRVTERMIKLTKKLKTTDQQEKGNF